MTSASFSISGQPGRLLSLWDMTDVRAQLSMSRIPELRFRQTLATFTDSKISKATIGVKPDDFSPSRTWMGLHLGLELLTSVGLGNALPGRFDSRRVFPAYSEQGLRSLVR